MKNRVLTHFGNQSQTGCLIYNTFQMLFLIANMFIFNIQNDDLDKSIIIIRGIQIGISTLIFILYGVNKRIKIIKKNKNKNNTSGCQSQEQDGKKKFFRIILVIRYLTLINYYCDIFVEYRIFNQIEKVNSISREEQQKTFYQIGLFTGMKFLLLSFIFSAKHALFMFFAVFVQHTLIFSFSYVITIESMFFIFLYQLIVFKHQFQGKQIWYEIDHLQKQRDIQNLFKVINQGVVIIQLEESGTGSNQQQFPQPQQQQNSDLNFKTQLDLEYQQQQYQNKNFQNSQNVSHIKIDTLNNMNNIEFNHQESFQCSTQQFFNNNIKSSNKTLPKYKLNYLFQNEQFVRYFDIDYLNQQDNYNQYNNIMNKKNQQEIQQILENSYYVNYKLNKKKSLISIIESFAIIEQIQEEKNKQQVQNQKKMQYYIEQIVKGSKQNLDQNSEFNNFNEFEITYLDNNQQNTYNYQFKIDKIKWQNQDAFILSFIDVEKNIKKEEAIFNEKQWVS
ncbi:hypothetical protein PPERSA_00338 [Pseudocohnilembus persalinus]|uniref:Transmembrane protein n=1 Tax=Pseudocohnilembus persalinus TaxID=266149 RepID=A0A0V0QYN3_PSEPJ|nr:hypothetical protein PPERSA_00338 [Pseudocohnilembus persalinus]|eukprot:KRX07181.1 hypothetical protein PPERSA_00338 [Pseudocohnilembus persalinus]